MITALYRGHLADRFFRFRLVDDVVVIDGFNDRTSQETHYRVISPSDVPLKSEL